MPLKASFVEGPLSDTVLVQAAFSFLSFHLPLPFIPQPRCPPSANQLWQITFLRTPSSKSLSGCLEIGSVWV